MVSSPAGCSVGQTASDASKGRTATPKHGRYLFGHKLKLQNGLGFAEMRDRADDGGAYRGWSWTTAVRLSW